MYRSVNPVPRVEFYPLLADSAHYPAAALSSLPRVALSGWAMRDVGKSAFLSGGESFVQGRYALAEALVRAGATPDSVVLLPALHCRVMVEPVMYLGAQVVFYPVLADLRPDFSALADLWAVLDRPVVALVLTHYFGFPNALDEMADFCAAHCIALIEDCAHAFYSQSNGRLLGTVGRYAIASPWKFLPVRDGGVLRDNAGGTAGHRAPQPWLAEARAAAALLQLGWKQQHRPLPEVDVVSASVAARRIAGVCRLYQVHDGLQEFCPEQRHMTGLLGSHFLVCHAAHSWIAQRRREHYQRWLDGVRDLPGVTALFPLLPEGVVPYAFPLLIDEQGFSFHLLKLAGIPIWRWEDMAVSDCAVARDYRIRLLQLPCHQALRKDELEWMIKTLRMLLTN